MLKMFHLCSIKKKKINGINKPNVFHKSIIFKAFKKSSGVV